jgi:hypothetical protein
MQRQRVSEREVALGVGRGGAADVAALDVAYDQQPMLVCQCAGLFVGAVAIGAETLEEGDVGLHARRVPRQHRQRASVELDDALRRSAIRRQAGRQRVQTRVQADHDRCLTSEHTLGELRGETGHRGRQD